MELGSRLPFCGAATEGLTMHLHPMQTVWRSRYGLQ